METKEFVIDDETMEVLQIKANRDGKKLEDVIEKYLQFITDLLKRVSPEVKAMQRRNRIVFDVAADFDWKEEVSNELYKKYIG